jgi:hypothetical protein
MCGTITRVLEKHTWTENNLKLHKVAAAPALSCGIETRVLKKKESHVTLQK